MARAIGSLITVTVVGGATGTQTANPAEVRSGLVLLALQAQAADQRYSGWIKRRVEQLEFLDTRAVRWRVSVDFKVPDDAPEVKIGGRTHRLIPVTNMPKGDLRSFSLRDESDFALCLPTADETNRRVAPAMVWRARRVLKESTLPGTLEQDVIRIIATSPREHWAEYRAFALAAAEMDARDRADERRAAWDELYKTNPWHFVESWRPWRNWRRADKAWADANRALEEALRDLRRREKNGQVYEEAGPNSPSPDMLEAAKTLMNDKSFCSQMEELEQNYLVYVAVDSPPGTRRIVKLTSERTIDFWVRR